MILENNLVFLAGLAAVSAIIGFFLNRLISIYLTGTAEQTAKKRIEEAQTNAQDLVLKAKEKAVQILEEAKEEERVKKAQLDKMEERILKKEDQLEEGTKEVEKQKVKIVQDVEKLKLAKQQIEEMKGRVAEELEKAAGMKREEAKEKLMKEIREASREDLAILSQKLEKERREEIEKKSLEIITSSIQRYARSNISEMTTSVYHLPDEDLKGKIIGREGRNIRTIERMTGVELIVDEAPDSVVLSSYDPMRREIARIALDKLLKDGRIQPAKIEEKVEEAKQELAKRMQEKGEEAALEVGVYDLPKEIIQLLGRLYFRTSYGQNVLNHSVEMAHIARMIASELGLNAEITKKAALLHDIGKAIDHEVEGTHVEIGRKILKKYNIDEQVIRAMESHHDDYPYSVPEAFVVAAADALSAARPGARRETVENFIKRLEELEQVAKSFNGVRDVYAISAGRELRVFVIPEKIDDFGALTLARDIAKKIESELKYPGEIKVNVIREMRAVEYAK
ncbi:MAG: ribonuclease Y [Candidatus Paceibacterota bacterium]